MWPNLPDLLIAYSPMFTQPFLPHQTLLNINLIATLVCFTSSYTPPPPPPPPAPYLTPPHLPCLNPCCPVPPLPTPRHPAPPHLTPPLPHLTLLLLVCRPDIVVPFMNYLADEGAVMESSSLLVAWLDLLTGMASGPTGASTVFGSLCMDASGNHALSLDASCTDGG